MEKNNEGKKRIEEMALDMIRLLQKWGLWKDVCILTNGSRYSSSSDREKIYCGLPYTEYEEGIDAEDMMSGITERGDCNENPVWESFANPEHIFDMVYEGPLYMLLNYGEYEADGKDISPEAWEAIFAHTDLLEDYMADTYGAYDLADFFEKVKAVCFGELSEEDRNECMDNGWDPLVFDTWQEYLEMNGLSDAEGCGKARPKPLHGSYGAYADYLGDAEAFEIIDIDSVRPAWEEIVQDAKRKFINQCAGEVSIPEIAGHVREEFRGIFEKYGLWYDPCFSWSLTAYRICSKN